MTSGQNMTRQCPQCGAPVSAGALEGLCPACLLKQGVSMETGTGASAPFEPPDVGEVGRLFPQLEIIAFIGKGGMGAVYKARQPALDRIVALKILPPQATGGTQFAERFAREARALARLNHPNIVAVHDFGQVNGMPFFVMEFVDGLNLREMERANRLSPREALQIVPQICEALQFAHDEGVVHRDIKPENILLDKKGRVKIADFGIAKIMGAGRPEADAASPAKTGEPSGSPAAAAGQAGLTEQGKIIGTPNYMAPEQVETPQNVDHRADIFSLGVVFYEMLTGELPLGKYPPPSSRVRGVTVDVRLDEVVLRALEREPEHRYQQASQVKTAVQNITDQTHLPGAHRRQGINYRSRATLFGLPLVHVATDMDPATKRPRVARGIIAIGAIAQGVVAFGGVAMGGFAFGGLSLGVLAFGGCAVGAGVMGGLAVAVVMAVGGLAIAPIAVGGGALGYFAYGGGALGIHPLGANASDETARHFFLPWAAELTASMNFVFPALLLPMLAVVIGVPFWLQRRMNNLSPNSPAQPGPSGVQGANQSAATPASLGVAAVFFAGLAGVLGALTLFLLPAPPLIMVWSILASALAGIVLGLVGRNTSRGRQAIVIGVINITIWLGVATVCWLRGMSPDPALPKTLAGFWKAEGNAKDSSPNGNQGTPVGGVAFTKGIVGQAFQFNGTSAYVHVPASASLNVGTNSGLTIEGWIKPGNLEEGEPLVEWNNGHDGLGAALWVNQPVSSEGGGPGSLLANIIDTAGKWHVITSRGYLFPTDRFSHVALTYDKESGTAALYLNGEVVAIQNLGIFTPQTTYDLNLGYRPPTRPYPLVYYQGVMDEMSIYGAALSYGEIQAIFSAGGAGKSRGAEPVVPVQPPGLVGNWQAEGNANDSSPYSNDGIFHGGATYVGGKVGSAFAFNNYNTYVDVRDSPSLNPREAITVTAWIYPVVLPGGLGAPIIKKAGNNTYNEFGYTIEYDTAANDSVRFGVYTPAGWMLSPDTPPTPRTNWSFVAGTYDGTNLSIYYDGVPVGSVPASGPIIPSPLDLQIGHDPTPVDGPPLGPARFFPGLVDEASVYDTALSTAQIQALYKLGMAGQRPAPDGSLTARTPALPGPVSWWAAESNADDSYGTNNGILGGGAGFAPGRVGQAFSFDGINGTVIVPDSHDLRLTGKLTIAAWINTLATNGDQAIISKVSILTGNHGYQFDLHGNRLTGAFNSPGDSSWPTYYVQTPVPITPGTWCHVAWTYDQSAMVLYFNGIAVATNIIGPQTISVTDADLRISGADDHVYFYGLIDEASVYDTALSAAQIRTLYKLGNAGGRPTLGPRAPVVERPRPGAESGS